MRTPNKFQLWWHEYVSMESEAWRCWRGLHRLNWINEDGLRHCLCYKAIENPDYD